MVIMVFLASFAISHNILKDGLTSWMPEIFKDRYAISDSLSILLTSILPVLGAVGAILALRLTKYIKNLILLVSSLFAVTTVAIGILVFIPKMNAVIAAICFGVIVCMMYGINNVETELAPLQMRRYADSGKMAGILNGFCYLGSTISSYGLGKIADIGGWQMVLNVLFAICIFMVIICFAGCNYKNE